jgi:adenylate cyclase
MLKMPWLGEEVTDDERYYNSYLSKHPYSKWENKNGKERD